SSKYQSEAEKKREAEKKQKSGTTSNGTTYRHSEISEQIVRAKEELINYFSLITQDSRQNEIVSQPSSKVFNWIIVLNCLMLVGCLFYTCQVNKVVQKMDIIDNSDSTTVSLNEVENVKIDSLQKIVNSYQKWVDIVVEGANNNGELSKSRNQVNISISVNGQPLVVHGGTFKITQGSDQVKINDNESLEIKSVGDVEISYEIDGNTIATRKIKVTE
ncbi:MAG: hypothetical protein J1E63_02885, partial [Muribaculaceae bacterium]|nr:hypothetical protein [Muribaculaceae bacterium]